MRDHAAITSRSGFDAIEEPFSIPISTGGSANAESGKVRILDPLLPPECLTTEAQRALSNSIHWGPATVRERRLLAILANEVRTEARYDYIVSSSRAASVG